MTTLEFGMFSGGGGKDGCKSTLWKWSVRCVQLMTRFGVRAFPLFKRWRVEEVSGSEADGGEYSVGTAPQIATITLPPIPIVIVSSKEEEMSLTLNIEKMLRE